MINKFLIFLSKFKSYKNHHKVYLVVSLNDAIEIPSESQPDWYFLQKIRDYHCTCQMGMRRQGSCVHVQCALYGATMSVEDKHKFKRTETMLGHNNFKNTFDSNSEDDAEQGEEYFHGK